MATKENIKIPEEIQRLMCAYRKETIYFLDGQWFFEKPSPEATAVQTKTKTKK